MNASVVATNAENRLSINYLLPLQNGAGITADLKALYETLSGSSASKIGLDTEWSRTKFHCRVRSAILETLGFASNHAVIGMGIEVTSSASTLTVQMVRRLSMK